MIQSEEWKPCHANDRYEVSDLGNIRSKRFKKPLKPVMNNAGYGRVQLSSSKRRAFIHRLVAIAFLGDRPGLQVNHINGIKLDNRVSNLEWLTASENDLHAFKTGLKRPVLGNCKLTESQAREIRSSNDDVLKLSTKFNVSPRTVRDIKNGVTWNVLR
jgi:hypothetical protein